MDLTLHIEGMSCGHCLNAVNAAVAAAEGVRVGSVRMGRAELQYDPAITSPARIIAVLREAGYPAAPGSPAAGGVG